MLDPKTTELIAIGVSVAINCGPCLDYHVPEAKKAGATVSEMKDAVGIARMVRKAVAGKMDQYTDEKLGEPTPERKAPTCCAGGGSDK